MTSKLLLGQHRSHDFFCRRYHEITSESLYDYNNYTIYLTKRKQYIINNFFINNLNSIVLLLGLNHLIWTAFVAMSYSSMARTRLSFICRPTSARWPIGFIPYPCQRLHLKSVKSHRINFVEIETCHFVFGS